jgi:hypothetical protein
MKTRSALVTIFLLFALAPASSTVRIGNDGGGQIGAYLAKYRALKVSGERVEIDGACASACTMLWASFHETASALRRAPVWSSTVPGISKAIRPLPLTPTGSCGRHILKHSYLQHRSTCPFGPLRTGLCVASRASLNHALCPANSATQPGPDEIFKLKPCSLAIALTRLSPNPKPGSRRLLSER